MTPNRRILLPRWVVPLATLWVPFLGGWMLWTVTGADIGGWMAVGVAAAVSVSGST